MNDYSKIIGYAALLFLLVVFIAWAKYSIVAESVFWTILIATCVFFVGWRVFMGVWPGNDAAQ